MSGDRVVNSSGVVNRDDDMLDRTLKKNNKSKIGRNSVTSKLAQHMNTHIHTVSC